MSAVELYLKQIKDTKGTWHKIMVSSLRTYMRFHTEEEIISSINKVNDASLLPYLWEVGLSQNLQDVANRRSQRIAGSERKGVI